MQDFECIAYVNSEAFKNDLEPDREILDTPLEWQNKTAQESPLITNFWSTWSQLTL
jgi:hypothetical protein